VTTQRIFTSRKSTEASHTGGHLARLPWMITAIEKKGSYSHIRNPLHDISFLFFFLQPNFFLIVSHLIGITLLLV